MDPNNMLNFFTYEQFVSAALANYKDEITDEELNELLETIQEKTGYTIIKSSPVYTEKIIDWETNPKKLKDGLDFNSSWNHNRNNTSIRAYLCIVAGTLLSSLLSTEKFKRMVRSYEELVCAAITCYKEEISDQEINRLKDILELDLGYTITEDEPLKTKNLITWDNELKTLKSGLTLDDSIEEEGKIITIKEYLDTCTDPELIMFMRNQEQRKR